MLPSHEEQQANRAAVRRFAEDLSEYVRIVVPENLDAAKPSPEVLWGLN